MCIRDRCTNIVPSGSVTLAAGGKQTYTCEHVLTSADQTAGSYSNSATVTATPPQGAQIMHTSNTVVVTLAVAEPAFTIEKLQRIGSGAFTTSPLSGSVGQKVEYEIVVKNTGNMSLELGPLSDAQCSNIVPSGSVTLAVGGKQTYSCEHVLTSADQTAGS